MACALDSILLSPWRFFTLRSEFHGGDLEAVGPPLCVDFLPAPGGLGRLVPLLSVLVEASVR